jgi:transglutaminase-like putative cysteine protease
MSLSAIYRLSLYVMLFLASMVLVLDAGETTFDRLHPLLVAVAGVAAFLTADRYPGRGLSRGMANALALAAGLAAYVENQLEVNLALAIGFWLVYLAIIKMFLPKSLKDDWYLFLIGLVQVVIGTFLGHSDQIGLWLLAWALSALWALGLFYLHREAVRAGADAGASMTPMPDRRVPYPGLLDGPFLFDSVRVAATTLALGGAIFLLMPRWTSEAAGQRGIPTARHLTGFSDRVRLGQIGEILENDAVVMTIELFQGDERIAPPEELLWRGVVLPTYRNGQWSRTDQTLNPLFGHLVGGPGVVRQRIRLEPTDSRVLFALRPVMNIKAPENETVFLEPFDGSISRPDSNSRGPFEYEVISALDRRTQPGEYLPEDDSWAAAHEGRRHRQLAPELLAIPDTPRGLRDRLRAIAEPIVAAIPESDVAGRARALETYLSDSGRFSYSLQMDRSDPSLDPVEDFLVNGRQGHCEYFASALALLLRSVGIPSRLVNGFKGGDWNALGQVLYVRQKHAHSWVEALLPPLNFNQPPDWLTLDPSPPRERDEIVARVGTMPRGFRAVSDYLRYIWIFYIAGFNPERQSRLIYEPIRHLFQEAARGFRMMWHGVQVALGWLLNFPNLEDFFSLRGFLVTTIGLLLLAALVSAAAWLWRRMRPARADDDGLGLGTGVAFYRRLAEVLASGGLRRPSAETPREFAQRAALLLSSRDQDAGDVADVPAQVVDAFYRVRFGQQELTPEALRHLEGRLDALEASLQPKSD